MTASHLGLYEKHDTSLLQTLFYYLKYSKDPKNACEALNIHKNTLYARLKRIKEFIPGEIDDIDFTSRLYISILYLKYNGRFPKS